MSILGSSVIYVSRHEASPVNRFATYVSMHILMIISSIKIKNEGTHISVYKIMCGQYQTVVLLSLLLSVTPYYRCCKTFIYA